MVHPLSDRLLRSWLRCRRKAWLDRHGDSAERLWNPHRALQLADRERRLQQCINQPLERCTGLGALQRGEPAVRLLLLRLATRRRFTTYLASMRGTRSWQRGTTTTCVR